MSFLLAIDPDHYASVIAQIGALCEYDEDVLRSIWRRRGIGGSEDLLASAIVAADEAHFRRTGAGLTPKQVQAALELQSEVAVDGVPPWDLGLVAYTACVAALEGRALHVMAVDHEDTVARTEAIAGIIESLGLSVAALLPQSADTGPPHSGSLPDPAERRSSYASDVVVGMPQQFALDFLSDHLATSLVEVAGHRFTRVFVPEADYFLLDQAFEQVSISAEGTTLGRIRLHEYFRMYPQLWAVTPVLLSETDRDEFRGMYGLESKQMTPPERDPAEVDVSFPTNQGRLDLLARTAVDMLARDRDVIVAAATQDQLADLSVALTQAGISGVDRGGQAGAEKPVPDLLDRSGVTLVAGPTRRSYLRAPRGSTRETSVLVSGRSMNRRDDDRMLAIARHTAGEGGCHFFLTQSDELVEAFSSPTSRFLESARTRLWRLSNGTKVGRVELKWFKERQTEWAVMMAEHRARRRSIDDVEEAQRIDVYDCRERLLAEDAAEIVLNAAGALATLMVRERQDAVDLLHRVKSLYEPAFTAEALALAPREDWTAVVADDITATWQRHVNRYGSAVMHQVAVTAAISALDSAWRHQLSVLDRIVSAYYKRSPSGEASTVALRAHAIEEFARMWQDFNERTVRAVLTFQPDIT